MLCLLIVATALQAALQIQYLPNVWTGDFRFWVTIATIISLCIVTTVQYLEHQRSRVPNGVVLFFWLFFLAGYTVKTRSLLSQQIHKQHLAYFVTFCASAGLAALEFVLEWLIPKKLSSYEALGDEEECPYERATIFSVLAFSWM